MKTLNIQNKSDEINLNIQNGKYIKTFNTVKELEDVLFFQFNIFHGFKQLAKNIFKLEKNSFFKFGGLDIKIL